MTEVLVLCAAGGALGLGLAYGGIEWFRAVTSIDPPPFWIEFEIDLEVMLFALAMVLLSGLFSGLAPAFRATAGNLSEALKDETAGSSSFRLGRFSDGLVVAEVALSCSLLIVAGLMTKSIIQLRTSDLPFSTANLFTARLRLPAEEYPDTTSRMQFYEKLLPKLSGISGVEAAALSDELPASGNAERIFVVEGQSYKSYDDYPLAREGVVTPEYFETFQTPILQGRTFTVMDESESLQVVMVNESFVRKFFPEGDVLGRRIRTGRQDGTAPWRTVIGVVPDMLMEGMRKFMAGAGPAGFYIPISQSNVGELASIAVRTREEPMTISSQVRAAVASLDPDLPIYDVMTIERVIAKETWPYRVFSEMFMAFGFIALFLACVGLYSMMCFAVSRRTKELGIRVALGADCPSLVSLMMKRGMAQLGTGMALGIALVASAAGPLQPMLYEVDARDPTVFCVVVLSLAVTGLLASFFPAHRVAKLHPTLALTPE